MVKQGAKVCPKCGGRLSGYDHVQRQVLGKHRKKYYITLQRLQCCNCGCVYREQTSVIFPYKRYESEIIIGVIAGYITCETFGFEDYPSETTMLRWIAFETYSYMKGE